MTIFLIWFFLSSSFCHETEVRFGRNAQRTHTNREWKSETISRQNRIHVTFRNMLGDNLTLFWVGTDFKDVDQGKVPFGKNIAQNTFPGHVFVLKDEKNEIRVMIKIGGTENMAIVFNGLSHCIAKEENHYTNYLAELYSIDKLFYGDDYRLEHIDLIKAKKEYTRAMNKKKNPYAKLRLAEMLMMSADERKIMSAYQQLEQLQNELGLPDAYWYLALLHYDQIYSTISKNKKKGLLYAACAHDSGDKRGSLFLGYYFSEKMKSDPSLCETARNFYKPIADELYNTNRLVNRAVAHRHLSIAKERNTALDLKEEEWEKKFESEDPHDWFFIGQSYLFGEYGLSKNGTASKIWLKKAMELDHPRATGLLAFIYWRGMTVEKDLKLALEYFEKGLKLNDSISYSDMGYMYHEGQDVKKDLEKAIEYLEIAASHNISDALFLLGDIYSTGEGKIEKNVEKAKEYYLTATIEHDHLRSEYKLATIEENCIDAVKMLKKVAEHEKYMNWMERASRHFERKEYGESLFLFTELSHLGYGLAQLNTGWLIEMEFCTHCHDEKIYEDAYYYYYLAASQDESEGLRALGDFKFYGHVPEEEASVSQAFKYYLRSVKIDSNNPLALFSLGYMYEHGVGTKENTTLAEKHYKTALNFPSEVTLGIKISLYNLYFKSFGFDMVASLCDSLPSVCHHWHDQMKLSDAFSRNLDSVDWTPLTQQTDFIIELTKTLLIAILLTFIIPCVARRELATYLDQMEQVRKRKEMKLGMDGKLGLDGSGAAPIRRRSTRKMPRGFSADEVDAQPDMPSFVKRMNSDLDRRRGIRTKKTRKKRND